MQDRGHRLVAEGTDTRIRGGQGTDGDLSRKPDIMLGRVRLCLGAGPKHIEETFTGPPIAHFFPTESTAEWKKPRRAFITAGTATESNNTVMLAAAVRRESTKIIFPQLDLS